MSGRQGRLLNSNKDYTLNSSGSEDNNAQGRAAPAPSVPKSRSAPRVALDTVPGRVSDPIVTAADELSPDHIS